MANKLTLLNRQHGALLGMFIGDALAMPVHWYYDIRALQRDYGTVTEYLPPKRHHPDSILWRSHYSHGSPAGDILHDQKQYWGKRNIHYHQFLQRGENTLNLKLAHLLLEICTSDEGYSRDAWLSGMIDFMTKSGNHRDTYVEEYLRHFFLNYEKGIPPQDCGRTDEKHIGGFSLMLPLLITQSDKANTIDTTLQHLSLTHGGSEMLTWGLFVSHLLLSLLQGENLKNAFDNASMDSGARLKYSDLEALTDYPDEVVVCHHFSSACYVQQAIPATLYLAVKYHHSPSEGLIANTMCGGDNCGRGTLLGALLGALNGARCWPEKWITGLNDSPLDVL